MRLTEHQLQVIRDTVAQVFGEDHQLWLFGSRVSDESRGGDIDLYIESEGTASELLDKELRLYARLQQSLGEQKIDLIVRPRGRPEQPIHREAKRTGVRL